MSDWRYHPRPKPRDASGDRLLRRDVRDLHEQPSSRLHRQCGADRGQQGRAARAGGDGADFRRHHRRHRSFGRRGACAHQLPGLVDRGRNRRRAPRSASSAFCWQVSSAGRSTGSSSSIGRLQPIVATIATGAAFFGLALLLRPVPGGDVYQPARRRADRARSSMSLPASLRRARRRRARGLGSL